MSRVPRASGTARSLFEFLACVLLASGCLPALELGAYRFGLPVSRGFSRWSSLAGRESFAPAGLPSRAPSPAAALLVGRVGFPPCRSARSARPLRFSLGTAVCPFGAVFVPLSRGWLVFLPSVPLPRPRFAAVASSALRGEPARLCGALWCASPLPPFRGVGSAVGLSFVFISEVLAPLTRGWLSPLRFMAPSDDTFSCLRFVAPSGLSASRLRRSAVPCRAVYIGDFVSLCDDTAENCVKAQRNPTAQPQQKRVLIQHPLLNFRCTEICSGTTGVSARLQDSAG